MQKLLNGVIGVCRQDELYPWNLRDAPLTIWRNKTLANWVYRMELYPAPSHMLKRANTSHMCI